MSLAAYFSGGKFDGTSWLREQLRRDALQVEDERVQRLYRGERLAAVRGTVASPVDYDPVLRAHCRIPERDGEID